MNVEQTVKDIKKLYAAVSGLSDHEVSLTYKGTNYGVSQPWMVRIDKREVNAKSYDVALQALLNNLQDELAKKITAARVHADALEIALKEVKP
jgi:hypothetical protein